ncbi:MAG: prolipoprotein diacylglyceryl transferase [Burkholderiales bacterium]
MFVHPQFDPIALHIGPLAVRWYGLMYLIAFLLVIILGRQRINTQPWAGWSKSQLDDALVYGVLGTILGGRLGYVLFYKLDYYLAHPVEIFYVWQGGMSFHGGFLGVIIAMALFARRAGKKWLDVTDFIAPLVPPGLAAGRLGNFINAELWGRPSDGPWAMVFPNVDSMPRHPSQLYEFALEGVAMFIILWWFASKSRPLGSMSALFLILYGSFRFLVEFTREPDDYLGLLALNLTMGQWLSLPMIAVGIGLMMYAYRKRAA